VPSIVSLNVPPLETRAVPNFKPKRGTDRESTPATRSVDDVPFEPLVRRLRIRRGGPRTPLPLLPVIAVAAGIGIAYVNQTAHVTTSTYQAAHLTAQQQQLAAEAGQLTSELSRLQSSERIISAAQALGMHPAARWAFVAASPAPVIAAPPSEQLASSEGSSTLQQLVGALAGAYGGSANGR
jgi:cell division protein FtsL